MSESDAARKNAINAWKSFPCSVRNDSSFSTFRNQLKCEDSSESEKMLTINVSENAVDEELLNKDSVVPDSSEAIGQKRSSNKWKFGVFFALWLLSAWHLLTVREKIPIEHNISIDSKHEKILNLSYIDFSSRISLSVIGPLRESSSSTGEYIWINVRNQDQMNNSESKVFKYDRSSDEVRTLAFDFYPEVSSNTLNLTLTMKTNITNSVDFKVFVDANSIMPAIGVISAVFILIFLNVLFGAEILHRTVAAIFTTFTSIGILAALHDRPSMSDVITWVDCETLLLIFSMMVLVAILSDTGFFENIALYAFQISRGRIWPLINILCVISAIISMFLDNVTTILLMTPVVIKLFECLGLNPVPILPFIILNINIGGLATLIGHPPNLLITENTYVAQNDITFITFACHMSVGVILTLIQTNIHLRIQCRNIHKMVKTAVNKDDELVTWQKCLNDLKLSDNGEEMKNLKMILLKKIDALEIIRAKVKRKGLIHRQFDKKMFPSSLEELKNMHPIRNKVLFRKAIIILVFIILLFFVETIPTIQRLSLGWCAFMGVLLLLVITDCNLDSIMQQIEWVTLIFFGAMFITMECLARLGLIKWIGNQTEHLILLADERMRLTFAIIIILWFSALSSSVVDSTPVTAMMVKVLDSFAQNQALNLPIKPIVFALAFGPTLGANGNLYGASSNILCAGMAEKLGHKMTCNQYFKIGFPVMIGNVLLVTLYLLTAHVLFEWH